jgi:hypothetical protein
MQALFLIVFALREIILILPLMYPLFGLNLSTEGEFGELLNNIIGIPNTGQILGITISE